MTRKYVCAYNASIMNMYTFSKSKVYVIIYLGHTYDVYHRLII